MIGLAGGAGLTILCGGIELGLAICGGAVPAGI